MSNIFPYSRSSKFYYQLAQLAARLASRSVQRVEYTAKLAQCIAKLVLVTRSIGNGVVSCANNRQ